MPWPWRSEPEQSSGHKEPASTTDTFPHPRSSNGSDVLQESTARERDIVDALKDPQTLVAALILTTASLAAIRLYKTQLRRIPTTAYIRPTHLSSISRSEVLELTNSKSLLGIVTGTHDPDNFRFFHTPGGRLLLWGTTLRAVPSGRALKDQTLSVRIAGIDAPELAHFGKPAQPYGEEALKELKSLVEGRRARIWPLRKDQYDRVVCLTFVKRNLFTWGEGWVRGLKEEGWRNFWRRDVGLEMIRRGAATIYEGKVGAEFGGPAREQLYRDTGQAAKEASRGMWKGTSKGGRPLSGGVNFVSRLLIMLGLRGKPQTVAFESPREYKKRTADMDKTSANTKHK